MKRKIVLVLLCMSFLVACKTDRVRRFAPGKFVNHSKGELSVASDTLTISTEEGNNFKAIRQTGFRLIQSGRLGKRQFEKEHWSLVYDESTGLMTELRKGRLLIFYPDSGFLLIGKRKYLKIE
ncbi:hypothetical protein [Pedobacter aquatilis]|uniref:hypothetical protein n=1 Tax=Pedobacter aquatilis TaxID=351343 RepID=UPI002931BC4A|nr:hypothetical protein [Pedobacter aquatilis]